MRIPHSPRVINGANLRNGNIKTFHRSLANLPVLGDLSSFVLEGQVPHGGRRAFLLQPHPHATHQLPCESQLNAILCHQLFHRGDSERSEHTMARVKALQHTWSIQRAQGTCRGENRRTERGHLGDPGVPGLVDCPDFS